ncbi:low temperature requirement protein A [Micromonospora cremea]|uniref:low temperature requirement protein A n=1 Tax=Micromonospora cremea TaxID=709881 RepID=UPI0013564B5D|nr:low temperature requirement protein A [Micromonospora cremea]
MWDHVDIPAVGGPVAGRALAVDDDTEMACSIVGELRYHDRIDQDRLAAAFAERDVHPAAGIPADWLARREPLPGYAAGRAIPAVAGPRAVGATTPAMSRRGVASLDGEIADGVGGCRGHERLRSRMTAAADGLRRTGTAQRATFLELFFDLAFVLALNRISQQLIGDFDAARGVFAEAGQTLLLFLAFWVLWAWTVLTTSVLPPDEPHAQLVVVGSVLAAMVMAVNLPESFDEGALGFAGTYVAVQVGRATFFWLSLPARRRGAARTLFWFGMSGVPWLLGGLATGWVRALLWSVAVLLDFAGFRLGWPAPRLGHFSPAEVALAGEHLAERHQQFLLITLGESILVIGMTTVAADGTLERNAAFLVAFLTTVLFWRIYFFRAGYVLPEAISAARVPAMLARRASGSHIAMISGIVLATVGFDLLIHHPLGATPPAWLAAMLGGTALFLVGRVAFDRQLYARFAWPRLVAIGLLVLLVPALWRAPPLVVGSVAAAVLIGVAAADTIRGRRCSAPPAPRA